MKRGEYGEVDQGEVNGLGDVVLVLSKDYLEHTSLEW